MPAKTTATDERAKGPTHDRSTKTDLGKSRYAVVY
jgi:hypothetical protein